MADNDFEKRSKGFLDWFQALPGATFHPDIQIADLRCKKAGRGIVATADIQPDTVLFTIPRDGIICSSTSKVVEMIPAVFGNKEPEADSQGDRGAAGETVDSSQDSWTSLILILVYEHLQGEKSLWKPYLDVLPTIFDTPMFWTEDELRELQASSVVSKVGKAEADKMIRSKILPVIRGHEDIFFPAGTETLSDEELLRLAHAMGSAVMAYAFDLEKDDDDGNSNETEEDEWIEDKEGIIMMGMVPMADILNADAEFNAHINHGQDALTATALRLIKAGDEILNYYGPLPNGELLRRYGYVTERHSMYDVVELPWSFVAKHLRDELKHDEESWTKLMSELDPEDFEDGFILEWGTEEPDSTGQVKGADARVFRGLPEEQEVQFKTILKLSRRSATLRDKTKRRELYLDCVRRGLRDRKNQYGTSLEEDDAILRCGTLAPRVEMAVKVRMGEKSILDSALDWVNRMMQELMLDDREGDERSAKRQKTE